MKKNLSDRAPKTELVERTINRHKLRSGATKLLVVSTGLAIASAIFVKLRQK